MIQGKIRVFKNINGEAEFPITSSNAVFMEDGSTKLTDRLKDINYFINDFKKQTIETNDTPRIQRAIDYIYSNGGGTLLFSKGVYILSNETIVCKPNVTLMGANDFLGKDTSSYAQFNCYAQDKPQFLLREYCKMKNFSFYYPEQVDETATTPIGYGWTIATDQTKICDDIQLSNLYFVNPYKAISLVNGGRHNLKHIYGQPIYRGIYTDNCLDIANWERIEFWTYTYYVGTAMYSYILNNAIAFEFKKIDGLTATNLFAYGYKTAYLFSGDAWATFVSCTADKCFSPIVVNNCNMVEFLGGAFIGSAYRSVITTINNVDGAFKMIGCNEFGDCSVGVINKSNTGKVIIDNVFFREGTNRIFTPVIASGTGETIVNKLSSSNKVFGGKNVMVNSSKTIGDGTLVKTWGLGDMTVTSNGSMATTITNGFKVDLGQVVSGDKSFVSQIRIDNDATIPVGLYYLEFELDSSSCVSDRKRFSIDVRNDTGTVIYNNLISNLPYMREKNKITVPFYLGSKPYITVFNFIIGYYDEPIATGEYVEITNLKLYKMNVKENKNSITEYLYDNTFNKDSIASGINYSINS